MLATWSVGFGTTALCLSVIGLYGLLSLVATRRRREIGLRMALGATPGAAVWLIVRDVLPMVGRLPHLWAVWSRRSSSDCRTPTGVFIQSKHSLLKSNF